MNIFDKLVKKYAGILPPKPESETGIDFSIPGPGKLPVIEDLSSDEMKDWENFIAEKKLLKELDVTKDTTDLGEEDKAEKEMHTVPAIPHHRLPPTKASYNSDHIMRLCKQYHDLCCKL
jgi:hypothetical protein